MTLARRIALGAALGAFLVLVFAIATRSLLAASALALLLIGAGAALLLRALLREAQASREARRHLASIVESMGEGVVVADREGRFTLFNPAAERIIGFGAVETPASTWREAYGVFRADRATPFPEQDFPLVRGLRGESTDDVIQFIRNVRRPEGAYISVNGRPIRDEHGDIVGAVAVFRDITDARAAEEALRASEARFRMLVDCVSDYAIFRLDPEGRVASWNAGAERIKGYAAEEILGRHFSEFFPAEDREQGKPRRLLGSAAELGRVEDEGWRVRKDGTRFRASVVITAMRDESGALVGFSKVTRDLTEQRRMEEELRRRASNLEEANRELEAFSYSVSHDLRAPLRHVAGFVRLLEERAAASLDDKGRHYLRRITDAVRKMGDLIDDLLAFSRIGRVEMRPSSVDLEELARRVTDELQPETEGRRIRWELDPLPRVWGDASLLRLALFNLLANSVKYTRPRDEAVIGLRSVTGSEGEAVFCVEDNGVGFDMRYAGKLFGVFQRLHSEAEFEGTGIGLANVRRIVQRHGGRTWAEGEPGKGARFYFSLPPEEKGTSEP